MIDLVSRASQGDHLAFERLAVQITPKLDMIARVMLRDRDEAEDAVQDALVRAWTELPRLRDHSRFQAWASKLVINICRDMQRRRPRHALVDISSAINVAVDARESDLGDRDQIAAGMARLKPEERAVLVLRYYLQYEPAEIAEALAIPQGTARSRAFNALRALRGVLDADARRPRPDGHP